MARVQRRSSAVRIERFANVVLQRLNPGARVLEIGAGDGLLAQRLAQACDLIAIDREDRGTFPVVETSFEAYDAPAATFDAIVMQLVLHHVDDIDSVLEKVERLLRPGGLIAVDDYGWERSDDAAFRADRADLLSSETMLGALRNRFKEAYYCDHAYFDEGRGDDSLGFTFVGTRTKLEVRYEARKTELQ